MQLLEPPLEEASTVSMEQFLMVERVYSAPALPVCLDQAASFQELDKDKLLKILMEENQAQQRLQESHWE